MLRDRTQNQMVLPTTQTKINTIPTSHRQVVGVVVFGAAFMIVFSGCTKNGREGRAGSVCLGFRFNTNRSEVTQHR